MNRAWSTFEIQSFDDEAWTFEGIASTPSTDRGEDIVAPLGDELTLPIPLMWQPGERKSSGQGRSVSVRVDIGGQRVIKDKHVINGTYNIILRLRQIIHI